MAILLNDQTFLSFVNNYYRLGLVFMKTSIILLEIMNENGKMTNFMN
jgi:hypothetical protein